jgi:hypothetical protein
LGLGVVFGSENRKIAKKTLENQLLMPAFAQETESRKLSGQCPGHGQPWAVKDAGYSPNCPCSRTVGTNEAAVKEICDESNKADPNGANTCQSVYETCTGKYMATPEKEKNCGTEPKQKCCWTGGSDGLAKNEIHWWSC